MNVTVYVPRLMDNGTDIIRVVLFPAANGVGVKLKDIREE